MDKPLTTPEQRRELEAKGWVFYHSHELDGVPEASVEEWLSPNRETVVVLGFEGPYAAYDIPGPWSEEYRLYPADPSNVMEFCAIIGWAPKGYVLVPTDEATPKRWQKLQARVAELESALRPFAALCYHGGIRVDMPDNTPMCISLGDIRQAHAVLAKDGDTND